MSDVSPDPVDTNSTSSLQPVSGDPFEAGAFQPTSLDQARVFYDKLGSNLASSNQLKALTPRSMAPGDYMQGKISPDEAKRQAFGLATLGMGGGLAGALEREGMAAAGGGLTATVDSEGAGAVGGGLRDLLQGTAPLDTSASVQKVPSIYNPPVRPSRPFEADYPPEDWPNGPPTDKQGYLTDSHRRTTADSKIRDRKKDGGRSGYTPIAGGIRRDHDWDRLVEIPRYLRRPNAKGLVGDSTDRTCPTRRAKHRCSQYTFSASPGTWSSPTRWDI